MITVKMELHELAFLVGFLMDKINLVNPKDHDYMKKFAMRLMDQYSEHRGYK